MLHHTSEITGSITVNGGSITLTNGTFNGTATSASYATVAETVNFAITHEYSPTDNTSILPTLGTNVVSGSYSAVLGGFNNYVSSSCSTIAGGKNNCVLGNYSIVGGGEQNCVTNTCSIIGGGALNCTTGAWSTVGGGTQNAAVSTWGTIAGGNLNRVSSAGNFVGGGCGNRTFSNYASVVGGQVNCACGPNSFIGGGLTNLICTTAAYSAILGGRDNISSCSNSFILGCNITDSAANTVHMNNACILCETRTQTLVETSAKRCKKNIRPLDSQLVNIKLLKPVNFSWKKDDSEDIGFIAEDVNEVYPDLVSWEDSGKIHGVKYTKLTSILVKALQEQQTQIDELKAEVQELKSKI